MWILWKFFLVPHFPKTHRNNQISPISVDNEEFLPGTYVTMEIPYVRLGSENLNPLPRIPYLEDTTAKVSKDGCVTFRGRVFNVDMRFAGIEGKIIDLEDTIFGSFLH
jgi:hypothetical protein